MEDRITNVRKMEITPVQEVPRPPSALQLFVQNLDPVGKTFCVFALCAGIGVAMGGSAIAWPICYFSYQTYKVMAENGYEQEPNVKSSTGSTIWVKKK